MTFGEVCFALRQAGIETAEWEAQLLIGRFCGVNRNLLFQTDADYPEPALKAAVERRAKREPLQYIFGEWDFYRQVFEVSPDCLIPRQDTEILVEEAIRMLPQGAFFADLCTGSGCIAISALAERPDTRALAVDISEAALSLAEKNAVRNGVGDRFHAEAADILKFPQRILEDFPKPDAILSNPPYIRTDVLETLSPEVRREPVLALDGGADGLLFYRALLELAGRWLKPDGVCLWEIGYDQADALKDMAEGSGFSCCIKKDYGGCDRVAILHRSGII